MARKVFISFLGSSFYGECQYSWDDFTSSKTRFVQQATLECIKYKENAYPDVVKILLTNGEKGSRNTNWDKEISVKYNFQKKQDEPYIGLEKVLEELSINASGVDIPDGKNEKEIWEIFDIIFDLLQKDDKLYLDLTHGFRYLPMLLLVLGNYAKFLKKVTVVHLSYGNYEARDTDTAPFVDLLPLSKLQNWSTAAKDFIDYGKTNDLKTLLEADNNPILRNTQGKDETAQAIRKISNRLQDFSETILANKLDKIIQGTNIHEEIDILKNKNKIIPRPFIPIIEKINDKLELFQNDDLKNVFAATKWCIRHELYQNAYSILLEGIISIVLNLVNEDYLCTTPLMEAKRGILIYVAECRASPKPLYNKETCITNLRISKGLQNDSDLLKSIAGKIWDLVGTDKEFAESIMRLSSMRNSYMHAGTGTNLLGSFINLKDKIKECNKKLYNWYQHVEQNHNLQINKIDRNMLINLSNHSSANWHPEQLAAAQSFGEVVDIPFPAVDPNGDESYIQTLCDEYVEKVLQAANGKKAVVHVMGEMTLTFSLVYALQSKGLNCMASTSKRITTDKGNGTKEVQFIFNRFRKYELINKV
jgi:CRISPR-associated Csx2 family protein